MSTISLMPLTNVPQTFQIELNGVNYQVTVKWNSAADAGWVMDIADTDGNPIAANIPLITGLNLLDGIEYTGINGRFYVYTDGDETAVPTLDNLGAESNLYFVTDV